jgi:adenylate cyclase
MSRGFFAVLLLGALAGVAAGAIPPLARLETSVGLHWLFHLRGAREPPDEVVLLGIARESARALNLPGNPRKWPRERHAELLDVLREAGARAVVFDLMFEEARDPVQDQALADAMRRAGNVILFQYLERDLVTAAGGEVLVELQRTRDPIPPLADAAAGLAPFPLPNIGARVDHLWMFKSGAGDAPSLPSVAMQQFALPHWPLWSDLLRDALAHAPAAGNQRPWGAEDLPAALLRHAPGGAETDVALLTAATRSLFQRHPGLAARLRAALAALPDSALTPAARRSLGALVELYAGPVSRTLDHYGGSGALATLPYHRVLTEPDRVRGQLRDRAVFLGYIETVQQEQKDSFRTVYTGPGDPEVGGVEIAATAFANLLERRRVAPLPGPLRAVLIPAWALLLALVLWRAGGWAGLLAAGVLAAGWLALAVGVFAAQGLWLPLVGPLLFQLPVVLLAALALRYVAAREDRRRMRSAFAHFVPERVVDDLSANLAALGDASEQVYGVCMSTDVESYTQLAERMDPEVLRTLLNRYYQVIFEPVRRNGGMVANVVGDSMMALWAAPVAGERVFGQAARAAVEIQRAVAAFNAARPEQQFRTRIGLHSGPIVLGHVGAGDRFEYRPVGDIVNTASRVENLGRQLGCRTLASDEVARSQQAVATRELGSFVLVGKRSPLRIHELLDAADAEPQALLHGFAEALAALQAGRWQAATAGFRALTERFPGDGPSRFYLRHCEHCLDAPPPPELAGVIVLERK